nr:Golgi reassembly-stacking protein 2 [Onthophagus taurus]
MGNANSIDVPGGGTEGYHILKVQENSPGSKAGLQAFFDYIVAINGTRLNEDNDTLKTLLKAGIGKQVPITVFSSKTQTVRTLSIELSDSWGGQGLLGVSIQFCSFEGSNENVWHILEVHPGSPAELAGLRSFTDYIVNADSVIHDTEDLFALIEAHEARTLKLYVYNSIDDACREVTITPNSKWGGDGSLGCGIGYGYLHRIPIRGGNINDTNNVNTSNLGYPEKSTAPIMIANTLPPINTSIGISTAENTQNDVNITNNNPTPAASVYQAPLNIPPATNIPSFNPTFSNSDPNSFLGSIQTAPIQDVPVQCFQNVPNPQNFQNVMIPQNLQNVSVPNIPPQNFQNVSTPNVTSQTVISNPQYFNPNANVSGAAPYGVYTFPQSTTQLTTPTVSPTGVPLLYDPAIAAKSAQLLLNSNEYKPS